MISFVPTPIGNREDITHRAIQTLNAADFITCEDTRHSAPLLAHYGLSKPLIALHDHNEAEKSEKIRELIIEKGQSLALISDAGTPLISDPGYKLIRYLSKHDAYITHIPGASSLNTAMVLSAQPTDIFTFAGFAPSKSRARLDFLRHFLHRIMLRIIS